MDGTILGGLLNNWAAILLLFLALSAVVTYALKKAFNAKTFYVASMVKTKKANNLFKKFSRHKKIISFVSVAGLIIGFGAIAVDYYFGKSLSRGKRLMLFFFSAALLYAFFSIFFGGLMANNPLSRDLAVWFGIVFAFTGSAGFVVSSLLMQAADIIIKFSQGIRPCPGVAPVIPGVQVPNVPIFIPVHAWVSILIILVVHEGFHGITALKEKIRLKSSGLLLFGFLPIGAFVEPNEIGLKKSGPKKQLKVYSAGPAANIFSMAFFFLLILFGYFFFFIPFVAPWATAIEKQAYSGVKIVRVDQNFSFCGEFYESPSYGVLDANSRILAVNGAEISTLSDFERQIIFNRGDPLTLRLESPSGEITEKTVAPTEIGWHGFTASKIPNPDYAKPREFVFFEETAAFLDSFFGWLIILSLLIALINFLPVEPFDGGKIAKIIFPSYLGFWNAPAKRKEKIVGRIFVYFILILVIINALPLFF